MAEYLSELVAHRGAWFKTLSAEDLGKVQADVAAQTAEENREAVTAAFIATWNSSDTNGDTLLVAAEYADFIGKLS